MKIVKRYSLVSDFRKRSAVPQRVIHRRLFLPIRNAAGVGHQKWLKHHTSQGIGV